MATRTQNVLGEKGRRIRELTVRYLMPLSIIQFQNYWLFGYKASIEILRRNVLNTIFFNLGRRTEKIRLP